MNIRRQLEDRLRDALATATGKPDLPALITPSTRPEFGDYQANGVMPAAKAIGTNPRKLAEKVLAAAGLSDLAESAEVAGPGFINIRLGDDWLGQRLVELAGDGRLGAESPDRPQTIVVDYSAPNLAKEMHVGHLRSTIIGDALTRVLEFLGHNVIRQNHVGDWGTQFGMLVANWDDMVRGKTRAPDGDYGPKSAYVGIEDMEEFYREAKKKFDTDPEFQARARQAVVDLQTGKQQVLGKWQKVVSESLSHVATVYRRVGVGLYEDHERGESYYGGLVRDEFGGHKYLPGRNMLPKVVEALRAKGLLEESEGAQCVFVDEFKGKDGERLPLIVQKSDEGYLYSTTDLAAIWFRCGKGQAAGQVDWKADRILYVVDARQSLHFRMVFAVARAAGFAPEAVRLEHVAFGTMMGADGRPFKTREGGTVKLIDLLDEGESRAKAVVLEKNPELNGDARADEIARIVGIGAIKYADLSQNRTSDYVFSFDKMLALDGNTAPYMQYAYARIRSIFRKGGETDFDPAGVKIALAAPAERVLAVKLLQFPETLQAVADECLPNLLCAYLYDLAVALTRFYENCPVLQSPEPVRSSRLALCALTAGLIRTGLDLLGIQTVEQM